MKANEFIKKFGWSSLKIAVTLPPFYRYKYVIFYSDEIDFKNEFIEKHKEYMFETQEVKRLVESHELIEKDFESIEIAEYEHMVSGCYSDSCWLRVKQAILDVESCQ